MCEFTFEVTDIPASDGLFTLQIDQGETRSGRVTTTWT